MGESWVKLYHATLDSAIMQDDWHFRLFIWCLLKANFRASGFRGDELSPGQFITGRNTGAEELSVSPSKFRRGLLTLQDKYKSIKVETNTKWTTISVINWSRYQSFPRESEQHLDNEWTTDGQQVDNERTTDGHILRIKESKKERTKEKKTSCPELPRTEPAEPPVMTFPTVGEPKEWILIQSKIDQYQETYPGIDALSECRRARQWCIDNKTDRKTAKGMTKFLNGWMSRSQNSNHREKSNGSSSKPNQFERNIDAIEGFLASHGEGVREIDGPPLRTEADNRLH